MNPPNSHRSLNDANAKLLVISISCCSAKKNPHKILIKLCAKKVKIVIGKEAIKKTVGSMVD